MPGAGCSIVGSTAMSKCYDDPRPTIQERLREWSGTPILNLKMPVLREAADEIDRLRTALAEKDIRLREMTANRDNLLAERLYPPPRITSDQINAAWAGSNAGCFEEEDFCAGVRWGLAELGIVACGKCGGSGVEEYPPPIGGGRVCPTCRHKGWVMEVE